MASNKPLRLDIELDGQPYRLALPPGFDPEKGELPVEVYHAEEVDALLPRLGSGPQLNYGDFPSTVEGVIAQDDWTNGLSPLRHDLGGKIEASYWSALGVDARRAHQVVLQPQATTAAFTSQPSAGVVRFAEFAGGWYCIAGANVWFWNGSLWVSKLASGGANFSDLTVYGNPTNTYLLACNGANYWYSTDGSAWTQAGGSVDQPKADYLLGIRSVLWKAVKPNKLYSTTDPTTPGAWTSTSIQVGDAAQNITALTAYKVDLAIGKTDGVWTVDRAGNDFPILPELRTVTDTKNCVNMRGWRNGLMFRVRNGLWFYLGTKLESIGLDRYRTSGITGSQVALQVVDQAPYLNEDLVLLQAPVGGGNATYLASLQQNPWRWHVFYRLAGSVPTACGITSVSPGPGPYLWMGRTTAGVFDTAYIRLPANTDNPLDDSGYLYDTGASNALVTNEFSPLPDQLKHFQKVVIHLLQGSAAQTLALSYAADGAIDSGTFTPMVGPQQQSTQFGLYQEWFFPAPLLANSVQFKATMTTGSATTTPVLSHLVLHYKLTTYPRRRWQMALLAQDRESGPGHFLDRRSAEQTLLDLNLTRRKRTQVTFIDLTGENVQVVVEKVSVQLLEKVAQRQRRYKIQVHLLEVLGTLTPPLPPGDTG